jgi:hypothetical protein
VTLSVDISVIFFIGGISAKNLVNLKDSFEAHHPAKFERLLKSCCPATLQ